MSDKAVLTFDEDNEDWFDLLLRKSSKFDIDGNEYELVGQFLENDDFYQGLRMLSVIRRKGDGRLFGYSYFDDISKHGDGIYVEPNGDEHGYDYDEETNLSYFVFFPVEEYSIPAYSYRKD